MRFDALGLWPSVFGLGPLVFEIGFRIVLY